MATSLRRLKKGSDVIMWPTRVVLLLRARAVMSESKGDAGKPAADGNGYDDDDDDDDDENDDAKNASSIYLQGNTI